MLKYIVFWGTISILFLSCDNYTKYKYPKKHYDIKITHVMEVEPSAVKLAFDSVSNSLWYVTFDGDVYRVRNIDSTGPKSELMLTSNEHGIVKLQGCAIDSQQLFLSGNYTTRHGLNNIGRMVRYSLNANMKMSVVFNTEAYGTNKTTFDHGWNAIVISPDKKFLYVNSGSRTDHGEIQDNNGAWPHSRDVALTAKVFRLPLRTNNIVLPNDEQALIKLDYLYAAGIRNAFGLAFDSENNLFAVSNSGDYDHPEDMFWLKYGTHYGFPWVMGGVRNPQQDPHWQPSLKDDPFINAQSFAFKSKYFYNDPGFPKPPHGTVFFKGIKNLGPEANEYRDPESGKIVDSDTSDVEMTTFTPHSSPTGLVFDRNKLLPGKYRGNGFLVRFSSKTMVNSLMVPFKDSGSDLLMLKMIYDSRDKNFRVETSRILSNLKNPSDCIIIRDELFILEYNDVGKGNLWKVKF